MTIDLTKGWSAVLLKMSEAKAEPVLTLRFVGEGLRTSRHWGD